MTGDRGVPLTNSGSAIRQRGFISIANPKSEIRNS